MAQSGPRPLIQFRNHFTQTVGLLGRESARRKAATKTQDTQTQNKRIHTPNIHALSGIRTGDPSFRASEGSVSITTYSYINIWDQALPKGDSRKNVQWLRVLANWIIRRSNFLNLVLYTITRTVYSLLVQPVWTGYIPSFRKLERLRIQLAKTLNHCKCFLQSPFDKVWSGVFI
jgi:hypothetical protein